MHENNFYDDYTKQRIIYYYLLFIYYDLYIYLYIIIYIYYYLLYIYLLTFIIRAYEEKSKERAPWA